MRACATTEYWEPIRAARAPSAGPPSTPGHNGGVQLDATRSTRRYSLQKGRSVEAIPSPKEPDMSNVLFTNVRIIDATGAQPYQGELLVQGNRIARGGRGTRSLPSAGITVIDGAGATLMPGT